MPKAYVEFKVTRTDELEFKDTIEDVPQEVIDNDGVEAWLKEEVEVDGIFKSRFEIYLERADQEDQSFELTEANVDLPQ